MAGYEVGSAYLTVLPSTDGFARNLSRDLDGPFRDAGRRGGETLGTHVQGGSGSGFLAAGAKFGGLFATAFAAIGAAQIGSAIASFLGDAITAASDLSETQSKVGQIFGTSQKSVIEFSKTASTKLGQSQQTALDGAATFGIFGQSAGLAGEELSTFSTDMVTLAGDLASFNNTSPEDAITAIGAALRGESEPIRSYGVLLDDATLKNRAMALGLITTTKDALTPQQRVLAAHAEILAQTGTQQGDFTRTSEGLANQQRIARAEFENTRTEIGTALLPIMTDLFQTFAEVGVPALQDLAKWFLENQDMIRDLVVGAVDGALFIIQAFLGLMEHMSRMSDFWLTIGTNMIQTWLNVVGAIINGAVQAFGWVPGLGDKLRTAQDGFNAFRSVVDDNFTRLRVAADKTTQVFQAGQDAVQGLRDKVQALNGTTATVFLNAQGNLTKQLTPGTFRVAGAAVGFRAAGGPIVAGRPYIVGENGPELVVPDRSGIVYNRSQIAAAGGGKGSQFNVNVRADAPLAARYAQDVADQTVRAWQDAAAVHQLSAIGG